MSIRGPPIAPGTSCGFDAARVVRLARIARYAWDASRNVDAVKRGGPEARRAADRLVRDTADAGVLFVKMSQFATARGDVLDETTVRALARLQDDVPCDPEPPSLPGYRVDPRPIASASIASVFKGRSPAGEPVAVKVVRPGVRERIETDLPLLVAVLSLAKRLNFAGAANMLEIVLECRPMLLAELDLRAEAKAQMAFRAKLAGADGGSGALEWLAIPRVREAGTSHMVSDLVPSRKITDARPNKRLAERLFEVYARMILDVGCVHADPHAGNVGVRPDGTLVMYDFGAVIDVRDARRSIAGVLRSAIADDVESGVRALTDMGIIRPDPGTARRLRRAMPGLRAAMASSDINGALARLPEFADNDARLFQLNTRYVYLIRSLVIVQGLIAYHDPDFSLAEYADEFDLFSDDSAPVWDLARGWLEDVAAAPGGIRGVQLAVSDVGDAVDDLRVELPVVKAWVRALLVGVVINLALLAKVYHIL